MSLSVGTRLGPYEIVSPLGAGGMGEVYRAHDTRLDRDVAVKVLPPHFADDAQALSRFEREAKAVAALSHPNILSIFDFGRQDGHAYAVTELLAGETLRSRLLSGPMPPRKAIDAAVQILQGLAAAHDAGIVHRDLKPENVFVTEDGRVKILDFGLARQIAPTTVGDDTRSPTVARSTEPGTVMGTVGYMSPEQVRGHEADARSDIFSFGAVLYEMLSGRRAFQRDTGAETMTAILKEDPPELSESGVKVPPGVDNIVRHCLEKSPKERFQSARDVAFGLQSMSSGAVAAAPRTEEKRRMSRAAALVAAGVVLLLIAAGGFWIGRRSAPANTPTFRQLTFRRGMVRGARFAPDGQSVVYAAAWEGKPIAVFSTRQGGADSSALELPSADLLAISPSGELALQLGRRQTEAYVSVGTLAAATLAGGEAPRERLQGVQWADWSPDGKTLAIVRDSGGRNRLESPVGTVLYETPGWIGNPRFSPSGDAIAFLDHWSRIGDLGSVMISERGAPPRRLTEGWTSIRGLAWRPDGREIWFTGTLVGGNRMLHAVDRSGHTRPLFRQTGSLAILDVSPKGEALVEAEDLRVGIVSRAAGQPDRDLSWLDFSALRDLTPEGRVILFDEASEGGGPSGTIFLRKTDGSPPVRLGQGFAMSLSPDGQWVIASDDRTPNVLRLIPAGAGEPRELARESFPVFWASWFPDGRRFLVAGGQPGQGARVYVQAMGGAPRPATAEGVQLVPYSHLISPDGRWFAATGSDRRVALFPTEGGDPRPVRGLAADELPCGWDTSGRVLYVYRPGDLPARVDRIDIESGARQPWKELMPADPTGVSFIRPPHITPDGEAYAYSYARTLTTLYRVQGLR